MTDIFIYHQWLFVIFTCIVLPSWLSGSYFSTPLVWLMCLFLILIIESIIIWLLFDGFNLIIWFISDIWYPYRYIIRSYNWFCCYLMICLILMFDKSGVYEWYLDIGTSKSKILDMNDINLDPLGIYIYQDIRYKYDYYSYPIFDILWYWYKLFYIYIYIEYQYCFDIRVVFWNLLKKCISNISLVYIHIRYIDIFHTHIYIHIDKNIQDLICFVSMLNKPLLPLLYQRFF